MKVEEFEVRAKEFWNDINGIKDLLNQTGKDTITDLRSPFITQYLLWRILTELKKRNLFNENTRKKTKMSNKRV